jgi:hypothetical protein
MVSSIAKAGNGQQARATALFPGCHPRGRDLRFEISDLRFEISDLRLNFGFTNGARKNLKF